MKTLRAKSLGMCFGVRDAITLALNRAQQGPVTIVGELVHNEAVLRTLRQKGIQIESKPSRIRTAEVLITAHGASERTKSALAASGRRVGEATCPLVHHAHQAVQRLVRGNYYPVIIGKRDHVEVRGLTEDLVECSVVLTDEDVQNLPERTRYGVASQTTQPIEKVHHLLELIQRRFPKAEVRFEDTVCQPTKQRQLAALELARQCDAVVVIGGASSNNTRELVNACRRYCGRVYHVQEKNQLRPEWFEGARLVGVTAGTSTPDASIEEVERWLRALPESETYPPEMGAPVLTAEAPLPVTAGAAAIGHSEPVAV